MTYNNIVRLITAHLMPSDDFNQWNISVVVLRISLLTLVSRRPYRDVTSLWSRPLLSPPPPVMFQFIKFLGLLILFCVVLFVFVILKYLYLALFIIWVLVLVISSALIYFS